ncbi:hypothetical protein RCH10_003827 [Variovorax sp. GrIS 2.14]|uniref:hypothetical protein n=1 Tax=Variovorax sp. GrIS 2.14 TaxID=3071709 RepID=UPI0019910A6A|nr:hypothetical protein [Ramlibacter sp.]
MAIKSGDICIVVGEVKGCEANIGAYLTVTEPDGLAWRFKDASRPLVGEFVFGHHMVPVPVDISTEYGITQVVQAR